MRLKNLEMLAIVAETGSLTRAATLLDTSQPTLSRDLRLLEADAGVRLLRRTGRGVELTVEGRRFLDDVRPHVEAIRQARERLAAMAGPNQIRIGWTGTISAPLGARIISRFTELHPHVGLVTMGGSSPQVQSLLADGQVDLAIFNSERKARRPQQEHLLSVPLHFVRLRDKPGSHAQTGTIALEEIARHPLYLHGRQHALRRAIDMEARKRGLALNILAQTDEVMRLLGLPDSPAHGTILPLSLLDRQLSPHFEIRRIEAEIRLYYCLAFSSAAPAGLSSLLVEVIRGEIRKALSEGLLDGRI